MYQIPHIFTYYNKCIVVFIYTFQLHFSRLCDISYIAMYPNTYERRVILNTYGKKPKAIYNCEYGSLFK